MAVNIFIIGRPGSGKSEANHMIVDYAKSRNISIGQVNDYDILYEMFMADISNQQFKRVIENGDRQFRHVYDWISGFEVKKFALHTVLSTALTEVAKRVGQMDFVERIITVEFARNDYKIAFQEFDPRLLQKAYFLYLETGVEICVQRTSNPSMFFDVSGNHRVPESIIRGYYQDQGKNKEYMGSQFALDHNIPPEHVMIIENEDTLENFMKEVHTCVKAIVAAEKELLPDTEKIQLVLPQCLKQKRSIEQP